MHYERFYCQTSCRVNSQICGRFVDKRQSKIRGLATLIRGFCDECVGKGAGKMRI